MSPTLRLLRLFGGAAPAPAPGGYERVLMSELALTPGSPLTIGSGVELFNDLSGVTLGAVTFSSGSKFTFDPTKDLTFTATQIMVDDGAIWQISAADGVGPYTRRARIILTGAPETKVARPVHPVTGINQGYTNLGLSRVISNHGTRYWRGVPKLLPKTKLSAHANTGATSATLEGNCSDYAIGDEIIIAPTNFAGQSNYERRTLTSVGAFNSGANTTTVGWATPLIEDHWGVLQYPIDAPYGTNSISLTPGTFTAPDADTPTVYDTRAEVLNISNGNISFEAPNDSAWAAGHGVTMMDHPLSTNYDEGVRAIRAGQRGVLARYPFHGHRRSYADVSSPVTFDLSNTLVKVNWPGHGITPVKLNVGSVTFESNDTFSDGTMMARISGIDTSEFYGAIEVTFRAGAGGTLSTDLVANRVYFLVDYAPNLYFVTRAPVSPSELAAGPRVLFTNAGSGAQVIDCSVSEQPVAFNTSGTLPGPVQVGQLTLSTAQFVGARYLVVGPSITPDSFVIRLASSAGAGSGTHTGLYTKFTQDRPDCRRIKCTVDGSENRAFVAHADCGTQILDCIFFDVRGQGVLAGEDGSEVRNKFYRNFGILVRNPVLQSDRLKDFDGTFEGSGAGNFFQSSAFWFAHPYNDCRDNIGVLADGNGVHNSYGAQGFGISQLVNVTPHTSDILRWVGNGGHSNWKRGIMTVAGVTEESGQSNGSVGGVGTFVTRPVSINVLGFESNLMEAGFAWKNRQGGYTNTVFGDGPFYKRWIVGDNEGGGFEGNTQNSALDTTSCLLIGFSNLPPATTFINSDTLNEDSQPVPRFGNVTYHFTVIFKNCSYHNFPWVRPYYKRSGQQDYGGGALPWRDLYTDSIGAQRMFLTGNKFNNSHPGHLTRAPHLAGYPVSLTLANPCVVTVGIADVNSSRTSYEFTVCENEPIRITRVSVSGGVLPAPLTRGMTVYAKNARDPSGALLTGFNKGGVTFQISLTPGGAAISTAGSTQSGTMCMHPMWRAATADNSSTFAPQPYINGMGTFLPDPEGNYGRGSTGSTPRWVMPYSDEPFFASDAANAVSCEPITSNGVFGLGISTTDVYVGLADLHTDKTIGGNTAGVTHSGLHAERYSLSDLTSIIGTYDLPSLKSSETGFFQDFQHVAVKNRGRYSVRPASDIANATTYSCVRVVGGNVAGLDLMIAINFSGSSTPNKVFRTMQGSGAGPYDRNTNVGMSVDCTAVGSFALASASSDGSKFWHDTTNHLVWVRWTALPGNSTYAAQIAALRNTDPEKAELSSWFVVQHV